ncbi:hypothetical protein Enr8_46170 [Blastopirellula retiformator]|uniref:Uncharacterized protein n=1 Tax=Blastopirellula retiformator TaxID=2527970 RepID=A0A5C5UWL5_9BACT|nr:hypothetical protein Enr8_46170 [Blastopirellula retiformator]
MGHTAPIRCPNCSAIQEVELKDVATYRSADGVTFAFSCDCGFSKQFENAPLETIVPLLADRSESQSIADFLGISRESYEAYVWPPDVRATIDKQRRRLPESATKRSLRGAALELPKQHDDRWWLVYNVTPPIAFDPQADQYGFVGEDGTVKRIGDIAAIVTVLEGAAP